MERVGAVLRDLSGQGSLRQRLAHARAIEKWPDIVGAPLAGRTRPLRVADGRLFVMAAGAALRQELAFHRRTILRKFNDAAGGHVAREVVFLESDALDYDETAVRPRAASPGADAQRADVAEPEPESEREGTEAADGPEETVVDRGAMYEAFDAAAYRARLARIAGDGKFES